MSVTRSRSPKGPPAATASSPARAPKSSAAKPASTAAAAKAGGWTAKRSLDLRLPSVADLFTPPTPPMPRAAPAAKAVAPVAAPLDTPVQQALAKAVDGYTAQVQAVLHHDAKSLAAGQPPVLPGDPLSQAQVEKLQSASLGLLQGLPVGALAPKAVAQLTERLAAQGVDTTDLASKPLGSLGDTGHAFAKELLSQLGSGSASTDAYALAGTLAAVAGYTAWTQGSQGLSALGFRPEFQKGLFDDKLQVKAGADWQAEFKDFSVYAAATAKVDLGKAGTLQGTAKVSSTNGFEGGSVDFGVERPNWNLAANASLSKRGVESVALSGKRSGSLGQVSATATLDANGKVSAAGVEAMLEKGPLSAKLSATQTAADGTQGSVVLGRKTDASAQELTVHSKDGRVDQVSAKLSATPAPDTDFGLTVDHQVATNTTTLGVTQGFKVGQGTLKTAATIDANAGLTAASVEYSRTTDRWGFNAKAQGNADGFERATVSAQAKSDVASLEGSATLNALGLESAELKGTYTLDENLKLTAAVSRDFQANRTQSQLEATWTDGKDASLSVSGATDSQGQSSAGVRLDVKF